MFGFAGQGAIARIFNFIFVDADLRANDEAEDSSKTIIGEILSRALDRKAAEDALEALAEEVTNKHDEINAQHLGPKLETLSDELSSSIGMFTVGRRLVLKPQGSTYTPPRARVDVKVLDRIVETALGNQGHGFSEPF
ncbi:hypothetical protein C5B85_14970 [Pseudoclavibacter sp. AY1F1]|nr:hypothetical protein C5B85_14970 [Pseudoclavibacter sp. AY1F1]